MNRRDIFVKLGLASVGLAAVSLVSPVEAKPKMHGKSEKVGGTGKRRASDHCKSKGHKKGSSAFSECMKLHGVEG